MNQNQNQVSQENTPGKGPNFINMMVVMFLITFAMNFALSILTVNNQTQITYTQFVKLVESESVAAVQIIDSELQIVLKENAERATIDEILANGTNNMQPEWLFKQTTYYTGLIEDADLLSLLDTYHVEVSKPIIHTSPMLTFISNWIFPIIIMYFLYSLTANSLSKRMNNTNESWGSALMNGMTGNVGKSKAKLFNLENGTGVSFRDVAGQDEAKESLAEMVDYLHNPEKYKKIGAKQPKGALLVGPPGTGKTLLAKAVAGEAGVPFYSLSGSEFVEMFAGVGASRVRDLFGQAANNTPCIVFIDEIDAIGKKRDMQISSNDEREQTLNQLLAEMDGFDSSKGILVLAATNRPEILDQALLRPGRFDRRVVVDKPDLPGREAILKVHADKVAISPDADLHSIALITSGATGADLANMVNEAALRAVKMGREIVIQEDLIESVEVVIAGKEKKERVLNCKEREMVAFHEVGHALVSTLQKNATPVQKITIVPRTMGSLGYTMSIPEDDRYLLTKDELIAQINTLLGGRAAEIVQFSTSTTGASNDIERATNLARRMVTQYGMSDEFGSMGLESTESQYLDGRRVATCSEQTNTAVDEEVRQIIEDCQKSAIELLQHNRESLVKISRYLLEKENITGDEFMKVLGEAKTAA